MSDSRLHAMAGQTIVLAAVGGRRRCDSVVVRPVMGGQHALAGALEAVVVRCCGLRVFVQEVVGQRHWTVMMVEAAVLLDSDHFGQLGVVVAVEARPSWPWEVRLLTVHY